MYSDTIKSALEKQVVGQSAAVSSVVRGVTRLVSGMMPRERSWCAYMFMGPTGTGKSHVIQALARTLHGDERRLVVDSSAFVHGDPWIALSAQLAPMFMRQQGGFPYGAVEATPLSIIQIDYIERGTKEMAKAVRSLLETGHVMLPDGHRGSLRNCLVFLTSGLCSREILDEAPRIGFTGTLEEDGEASEHDRVFDQCLAQAEENFGSDLVGRLDSLVIFHRLEEHDLAQILDRRIARLNRWLATRGFQCELQPEARAFLQERGRRDLRKGARDLVRAHRRFIEFPLADLLLSGRIPHGGVVVVDRKDGEEHLDFRVLQREVAQPATTIGAACREIPISWEEPPLLH